MLFDNNNKCIFIINLVKFKRRFSDLQYIFDGKVIDSYDTGDNEVIKLGVEYYYKL